MNASAIDRAQKTGRRIGTGLFALFVGTFTIVCSVEVLHQGFFPRADASMPETVECRAGLQALVSSLASARTRAAASTPGERTRLAQFRGALGATWQNRYYIERRCQSDAWALKALERIDELRWAEEHAVRYESADLAPSRQQVAEIEKALADATATKP